MEKQSDTIDTVSLMFETARSFIGGAKIIVASEGIEDDGVVRKPTIPVTICSAIAMEVQLKALIEAEGCMRPSGDRHDLNRLFETLPENLQASLLDYQMAYTGYSPDQARQTLFQQKDVFKVWRYPYEKDEIETNPAFLLDFAIAISDYIRGNFQIERSKNGWLKEHQD